MPSLVLVMLCTAPDLSHSAAQSEHQPPDPTAGQQKPQRGFTWYSQRNPLPKIDLVTIDGTIFDPDILSNRIVILNFWASWCAPCLEEIPAFSALQNRFSDDEMMVVLVNEDRNWGEGERKFLARRLGIDNLLQLHDRRLGFLNAVIATPFLPVTLIIDRKQQILGTYLGPWCWDSDAASAMIQHLIDHGTVDDAMAQNKPPAHDCQIPGSH